MCEEKKFPLGSTEEGRELFIDDLEKDPLIVKKLKTATFYGHFVVRILGIYRKDLFDDGKSLVDGLRSGEVADLDSRNIH